MEKTNIINIQGSADIKAEGKLNNKNCKPVICLETGDVFTSVTDAARSIGVLPSNLSTHLTGKSRHIHGKHFCYLSHSTESLDAIVTRLRETAAMEEDAKKWRAHQAEQEAKRIAEEKRQEEERKAKEKFENDKAKLVDKIKHRTNIANRIAADFDRAMVRVNESKDEYYALTGEHYDDSVAV